MRPIRVTNSMTGKKELLETRNPGKLTLYSCGPTVYNFIHIGNLRTALVADLFYRYFKKVGYEVTYVRNYTDVDDRIIAQANQEKTTTEVITKKYIQEVEKDYAVAGMLDPTHKPTVLEHMRGIVKMIEKIITNGQAYVAPDGEVLFSVEAFPTYGKLSGKNLEELAAGIRVEVSSKKRNPQDFTLWKPAKPGEPSWDSPWGQGRPGWHIECSAMSSEILGDEIDVHHGGEDLVFPHHENEIAQSESASKHTPFVRYWMHSAFLTLSKEKMSKSIGNVFLAREFLTQYSGEIARFLLLQVHYRTLLDFSDDTIDHTLTALHRIYEAKAKAQLLAKKMAARPDLRAEGLWGEFVADCEKARQEIDEAYANDFNTPAAVGALFTLIREFNRVLGEPMAQATPSCVLGAQALLSVIESDIGDVIGIGRLDSAKALADIERVRAARSANASGQAQMQPSEIEAQIQARADARKAKDFAKGDQIRKDLEARGVIIKDSPTGTTWQYK